MATKPTKPVPKKPRKYTQAEVDSLNAEGERKMVNDRARRAMKKTLGEKEYRRRLV